MTRPGTEHLRVSIQTPDARFQRYLKVLSSPPSPALLLELPLISRSVAAGSGVSQWVRHRQRIVARAGEAPYSSGAVEQHVTGAVRTSSSRIGAERVSSSLPLTLAASLSPREEADQLRAPAKTAGLSVPNCSAIGRY